MVYFACGIVLPSSSRHQITVHMCGSRKTSDRWSYCKGSLVSNVGGSPCTAGPTGLVQMISSPGLWVLVIPAVPHFSKFRSRTAVTAMVACRTVGPGGIRGQQPTRDRSRNNESDFFAVLHASVNTHQACSCNSQAAPVALLRWITDLLHGYGTYRFTGAADVQWVLRCVALRSSQGI